MRGKLLPPKPAEFPPGFNLELSSLFWSLISSRLFLVSESHWPYCCSHFQDLAPHRDKSSFRMGSTSQEPWVDKFETLQLHAGEIMAILKSYPLFLTPS